MLCSCDTHNLCNKISFFAVICLREHLGLSGKAIICYVEHPEEYQVEEVQILLKNLHIIPKNSKPSNVLNSNLYI